MSPAADLSLLPPSSLDGRGLTAQIASRYHQGMPFCTVSTRALVAVNTFAPFDVNQDQVFKDMAARVCNRMQCRGEPQVVLFLGETGTGKTEFASALSGHILTLAGNPLSQRVRNVHPVLEAFGTAKTAASNAASKFGMMLELQYDHETTLIGSTIMDFRLERQRVTKIPTNERNFNVFYYMVNGLTEEERYHLQLTDLATQRFRYLGHPSQLRLSGVDDKLQFKQLKASLFSLGFLRADVANIFQVLAAILHLGQIKFRTRAQDSSVAATTAVEIANLDVLELVASFLGVLPETLATCLVSKTVTLNGDRVTVVLDCRGAQENCDEVARTLYALMNTWILDRINTRLSMNGPHGGEDYSPLVQSTITLVDFPGFNASSQPVLDRLLYNTANEMLYHYMLHVYFQKSNDVLATEDVDIPNTEYFDNTETIKDLIRPRVGVISLISDYAKRDKDDQSLLSSLERRFGHSSIVHVDMKDRFFSINHYEAEVDYPVKGILEESREQISADIISLFTSSSSSDFLKTIFQSSAVVDKTFGAQNTVVAAHFSSEPKRQPSLLQNASVKRSHSQRYSAANERNRQGTYKGGRKALEDSRELAAPTQFVIAVDKAIDSFDDRNAYFVLCLKPNDHRLISSFDARCVRQQVTGLGLPEIAKRTKYTDHSLFMPFSEYLRYASPGPLNPDESEREQAIKVIHAQGWPERDICYGTTGVFLSENAWLQLVDPNMSFADAAMKKFALHNGSEPGLYQDMETKSLAGGLGNMFRYADDPNSHGEYIHVNDEDLEDARDLTEPTRESRKRRNWLMIVWFYTWYIPDYVIRKIGKMPFKSVRIAWREKLTINMIIWGMCIGCMLFLIGFPYLVCPLQDVMSPGELSGYSQDASPDKVYVSNRGIVYDITKFAPSHYPVVVPTSDVLNYGGKEVADLFPIQLSAACGGVNGSMSEFIVMGNTKNYTDQNAQYHDFRAFTNDSRPDWYLQQMHFFNNNYLKSYIGYTPKDIKKMSTSKQKIVASIHGMVYDLTDYVIGDLSTRAPAGYVPPPDINTNFMDSDVVDLFQQHSGQDITKKYKSLSLDDDVRRNMDRCLRNVFLIGKVDSRGSVRCLFARYFLLAVTVFVVAVIVIKFVAALQFGGFEYPDDLDRFVICQVPAYTEDEASLRRAIDSLARTKYDDKRKLLVVICDGMIVGAGNEKPTPRIVLDILGCPEEVDPPALAFESLGEGDKQLNMGKIYTGLYEVGGHIVPYLVIVKVGKPNETFRPGNRGKRDSQMLLMRFLNRVHYNSPMSPLELELYNQIQNVIGVNPGYYEFLMQVDADTVVSQESLSQLVGKMVRDNKVQGVCGETALSNARHSLVTMIQVYEYYISHNLAKAFESLFGSVTCLPGCFTLYRIYEQRSLQPVFVSTAIVEAYSENHVRTLHDKNLLQLGEDRYLTTLMLKYNPKYSTRFLRQAHAWTVAPDSWSVFLSQRRRWINSTVHNLVELVPMSQLCGFCCFGMRFIVLLDLFSTLIQPVTCAYLAYLIYLCIARTDDIPITSIAMVAAIYGLQAFIFVLRRKWEMIGWMFVYILALPIFSLVLPLYSFWYMDDFSWGNTRMVLGEQGEKLLVTDEGHFDPSEIPRKTWTEYEAETWEKDVGAEELAEFDSSTHITPRSSIAMFDDAGSNSDDTPSDTDITEAIREILATADLSKVTKRSVRMQLEHHFNCKLANRREYISHVIEALLAGEL